MDKLPEEILVDVLDYLEPEELISIQRTCSRLSIFARASPLWRYKCFERSPSASMRRLNSNLNTLTSALQGLTLSERPSHAPAFARDTVAQDRVTESARARAVNQWDLSGRGETVDWFSEYKSRYAPLSVDWLPDEIANHREVRGVSLLQGADKVLGHLEDGSLCIWDLSRTSSGRRKFQQLARSKPSSLQSDSLQPPENLVVDCVSSSFSQQKAHVAIGDSLHEVDLNTLQTISQSNYPYPITSLSQPGSLDLPLTVGTQWSLHVLDPRLSTASSPQASSTRLDEVRGGSGRLTAMLPDISGDSSLLPSIFGISSPFASNPLPPSTQLLSGSPSWRPSHRLQNPQWMGYAKVEPGPLSILHHAENEILICGRFPSILSYDRRYFPRLQYVIHSSASLSAMTSIPHPPAQAGDSSWPASTSTLVACGEYRGRGSLELYSLPHIKASPLGPSPGDTGMSTPSEDSAPPSIFSTTTLPSSSLYSYKNRQDAAKSKLLSVAAHGTKIVYSDSEGGLKWVERDGHSLVRRWNINGFQLSSENEILTSASTTGDLVARKIIPLPEHDGNRGVRGDADLLIWTGEKVGVVTTTPQFVDHEEMVLEMEGDLDEKREQEERARQEEEYSKTMRRALERQADERRWMSRFRFKMRY
jgi:hypothetical protein